MSSALRLLHSKPCLKRPFSKRPKIGFQDILSLNAGQKYCRMLQGEHSAILWSFIKLPFVIKIFVLSIFEWLLKTGFTVHSNALGIFIRMKRMKTRKGQLKENLFFYLFLQPSSHDHLGVLSPGCCWSFDASAM